MSRSEILAQLRWRNLFTLHDRYRQGGRDEWVRMRLAHRSQWHMDLHLAVDNLIEAEVVYVA